MLRVFVASLTEQSCGVMLVKLMPQPSHSKREHLHSLVAAKQKANEPPSALDMLKGFRGWHERGYLPHCDEPGLIQFVTFRVWDSMPAAKRGEWEHLLAFLRGMVLRPP